MQKEPKTVRIVFEAPSDVQYLLRVLAAKRNERQKDTLRALIEEAAKAEGIAAPPNRDSESL